MDEEEDDFYDPTDSVPLPEVPNDAGQPPTDGKAPEANEGEEVEVEDDEVGENRWLVYLWLH